MARGSAKGSYWQPKYQRFTDDLDIEAEVDLTQEELREARLELEREEAWFLEHEYDD